jgi:ribosome-associated protein
MLSKKATDIVIIDLRKVSTAADYFVICTADSDVQVRAIADAIEDDTRVGGEAPWHAEGKRASIWIVLDYVDVVAHVFHKEARAYYNLERLWSDAKMTHVKDGAPPVRKARAIRSGKTVKKPRAKKLA